MSISIPVRLSAEDSLVHVADSRKSSLGSQALSVQDMFIRSTPLHPFFETLFNTLLLHFVCQCVHDVAGAGHIGPNWLDLSQARPPIDLLCREVGDASPGTALVRRVIHHGREPRQRRPSQVGKRIAFPSKEGPHDEETERWRRIPSSKALHLPPRAQVEAPAQRPFTLCAKGAPLAGTGYPPTRLASVGCKPTTSPDAAKQSTGPSPTSAARPSDVASRPCEAVARAGP